MGSVSNDGYGVPEVKDSYAVPEVKDGYGAPEISTSSTYEAPKAPSYTTTIAPCSYQAPTTTAPSYDAPAPKKHIFGDILGFIGNLIKPKKQETSSNNCLTAPEESSYSAPETPVYNAPEEGSATYEAPESSYNEPEIAINERGNLLE